MASIERKKSSRKRVIPKSRAIDKTGPIYKAADVLRNQKRYMIPITAGVFNSTNCECFKGSELLDALVEASKQEDLLASELNIKDRPSALKIAEDMLAAGYFFEADFKPTKRRTNRYIEKPKPNSITEEAHYIWVMPASLRQIYMYSALLVVFTLFITLIKVWPIWLKIAIWWLSLITLTSMSSVIVIRLIVYCLFWMVGVRDIWLLPNFLDDAAPFEELLTPLFGRGYKVEQKLAQKKAKLEKELRQKHEREGTEVPKVLEVKMEQSKNKFGLLNLIAILSLGFFLCLVLGIFNGENIPDFLVNKNEMLDGYSFLLDDPATYEEAMHAQEEMDAEEAETVAAAAKAATDQEQARIDALLDQMMEDEDLDLDEDE